MANGLYDFGRESYLGGDLAWDTNDVRTILVDEATDVPDLALDKFLSDRAAGSRVSVSGDIPPTRTIVAGVADGGDVTHTAVSGAQVASIDLYYHTTVETTSILICNIDTATGLPLTPNGNDVIIQWNASGIFKL